MAGSAWVIRRVARWVNWVARAARRAVQAVWVSGVAVVVHWVCVIVDSLLSAALRGVVVRT